MAHHRKRRCCRYLADAHQLHLLLRRRAVSRHRPEVHVAMFVWLVEMRHTSALLAFLTFAGAGMAGPSAVKCPSGAQPNGEKTPDATEVWCEKPVGGRLMKHGPYRAWHANGQLGNVGQYSNGAPSGKWAAWHANGRLQGYELFKHGKVYRGQYWDDQGLPAPAPIK